MTSARPTGWPGCVCPGAGRGCSLGPARDGRRQQAWRPGRPTSPTRSLWRGLMSWRPAGCTLPARRAVEAGAGLSQRADWPSQASSGRLSSTVERVAPDERGPHRDGQPAPDQCPRWSGGLVSGDWLAEVPLAHGADALPERRDLLAPRLPDCRRFPRPKASRDDARHVLNVSHQLAFSLQFRGVQRSAVSTDCAGTAPRSALVLVSGHFSRQAVSECGAAAEAPGRQIS